MDLQPNNGKKLIIEVNPSISSGQVRKFARIPIKTKLITPEDKDILPIVEEFALPYIKPGDILFISEKVVAVTQGRSYPITEIKAGFLAKFLSKFVTKTPIGIGLGSPETMQLAIEEVGSIRILIAAFFGFIGKLLGIKGIFYYIAGEKARSIDGAVPYAIPPYNTYVSKGPRDADSVARIIKDKIKTSVAIVDANDFGVNILGWSGGTAFAEASTGQSKKLVAKIIKDNPLGQTNEQTPIGIIREITNPK